MKYHIAIPNKLREPPILDLWKTNEDGTVQFMYRLTGTSVPEMDVFRSPMPIDFIQRYTVDESENLDELMERAAIHAL